MVRQTRPSAGSGLARPARTPALLRGPGFVTARINPVGMALGQLGAALKGRGRTRKRLSATLRQLRAPRQRRATPSVRHGAVLPPSNPPQPARLFANAARRASARARDAAPASHYRGV
jgi:hypothetical protein